MTTTFDFVAVDSETGDGCFNSEVSLVKERLHFNHDFLVEHGLEGHRYVSVWLDRRNRVMKLLWWIGLRDAAGKHVNRLDSGSSDRAAAGLWLEIRPVLRALGRRGQIARQLLRWERENGANDTFIVWLAMKESKKKGKANAKFGEDI